LLRCLFLVRLRLSIFLVRLRLSLVLICGVLAGGAGVALSACAASRVQPDPPLTPPDVTSAAPLQLEPGEVAELAIDSEGNTGARLATPSGAERFVLILGSTRFERDERAFPYRVAHGEVSAARASILGERCSIAGDTWRNMSLVVERPPSGVAPVSGAERALQVVTPKGVSKIKARALSVGQHATIWVDTTHPTTLDLAFTAQFLSDFERIILPRARQIFGTESDLDGDGRIQLVFTRLTRERGVAFFTGCDLAKLAGCEASNAGEYLYLTPPDAIDPPYNTPNAIKEILTHELGHLLHFNRKVLRNRLSTWSDGVFLSEGVGALAQDVTGYQAGNLYVTQAGLEGIGTFSLGAVFDARHPEDRVDGVLRGGAYLFVRYLYDRAGGDAVDGLDVQNRGGPALWRTLLESPKPVATALFELTGANPGELAMDFFSTLVMSDREQLGGVAPRNPCFDFLPTQSDPVTQKQRGASPFASFHGSRMTGPALGDARAPDGSLRSGGVDYLSLGAARAGSELVFALHVDPEARPRLRLGRLE